MSANYVRLTASAMETMPPQRQAEVYDFAKYVKERGKNAGVKRKRASVLTLIGIAESRMGDIAGNHDKYLYE